MRTALVSPRTLEDGDKVIRVTRDIHLVPVEIGRVTAIKHGGKVVAYKVYPKAWLDDQAAVAADASKKHLAPFTLTTRDKIEKVVAS